MRAATLLEWDAEIPPFEELHSELLRARQWTEPVAAEEPAP
jgi:hypothetical protein